ncbi:MAG: transposase [Deltaproteobacteria bacterium]|nr:transposase [Deltaproteobacteria bacterium]
MERTHGGRREGAGRPRASRRWGIRAKAQRRPEFSGWRAFHVTQRVSSVVGRLRRRDAYHALRKAMQCAFARRDFRIVHISIEHDHLHLVVEAASGAALRRGMHGFLISAARRLNNADGDIAGRRARLVREHGRTRVIAASRPGQRGAVFEDPYHLVAITSPRQARNTIAYVLNNYRHHGEPSVSDVDFYSSGPTFRGWSESPSPLPTAYQPLPVQPPGTWLLATGWRKAGPISLHEVPSTLEHEGRLIPTKHARPWG